MPRLPSRWQRAAIAAALFATVAAVYAPARHYGFLQLDDNEYVTENAAVRSGLNAGSVRWAFTAYHSGHWHPLTWLSLAADCQWFGVDPGALHRTNVVLHAIASVLLFFALHSATGRLSRSAVAAGLFALHPLRVESVAWIAARKDVLSGFFLVLLLLAWSAWARKRTWPRYAAVFLAFACGLLAKPTLAVVPAGLLLMDWWPLCRFPFSPAPEEAATSGSGGRRSTLRLVAETLPLLALSAATLTNTWAAQNAAGAVMSSDLLPLSTRLANATWNYALYLARSAWPFDLAVFYPLARVPADKVAAAATLLCLATLLAWRQRARRPWLLFGWLWFCGTLLPVSGIIQFGGQAMADRYSYIPHVGLLVAVVWEAADRLSAPGLSSAWKPFAAAFALAASAALSSAQLAWWSDSLTLLGHAIDVTSGNYLAHNNLGVALEALGRRDEAAAHYEETARLNPTWPEAQNNVGIASAWKGRIDEAIAHFEAALRVRPDFAKAHNNLATALSSQGKADEAIAHFRRAIEIDPSYVDARVALGLMLERRGELAAAEDQFRVASSLAPGFAPAAEDLARVRARMSGGATP